MADVNCVLEIEMRRQCRKIVGVVVHVVAVAGLGGSPMAAPVMGDDAIAVLEEEQHLGVPVIGRQGPAVAEHDGLTASPVLVEDLRAIRRRDRAHVVLPSCWCWFPHVLGLPSLVGPAWLRIRQWPARPASHAPPTPT